MMEDLPGLSLAVAACVQLPLLEKVFLGDFWNKRVRSHAKVRLLGEKKWHFELTFNGCSSWFFVSLYIRLYCEVRQREFECICWGWGAQQYWNPHSELLWCIGNTSVISDWRTTFKSCVSVQLYSYSISNTDTAIFDCLSKKQILSKAAVNLLYWSKCSNWESQSMGKMTGTSYSPGSGHSIGRAHLCCT